MYNNWDIIRVLSGIFLFVFGLLSLKSGLKGEKKIFWMFFPQSLWKDNHPIVNIIMGSISSFAGIAILFEYVKKIF